MSNHYYHVSAYTPTHICSALYTQFVDLMLFYVKWGGGVKAIDNNISNLKYDKQNIDQLKYKTWIY